MMWSLQSAGRAIVRYLEQPARGYEPFLPSNPDVLPRLLRPGDVLLIEGNSHLAGVIKYLTHSAWSHAALYVGPIKGMSTTEGEPHVLVESNIGEGVVSVPLSRYSQFHTRICRPIGLTLEDRENVCAYAVKCIGLNYDVRNLLDLGRYLVPLPVPQRWRRRMVGLGSGSPTKFICSALIAGAFQSVHYPILPKVTQLESKAARREVLTIRQSSLYMPRDFDISPYFAIIKPTIEAGFDYKKLHWADLPTLPESTLVGPGRRRRSIGSIHWEAKEDQTGKIPKVANVDLAPRDGDLMRYHTTFSCGNSKYYVIEQDGCFIVRRQDWIERTFIGYASDVAEAMALIRHDARSSRIRAEG